MGREREGASDQGDKWQESKESQSTRAYEGAEQTWKDQSKDRAQVKPDNLGKEGRISSASGFELFDPTKAMKAESASIKSPFNTGVELHGQELDQAGIKHENVKHEITKDANTGAVHEKSTVKYPDGLEIEVNGTSEHRTGGRVTDVSTSMTEIKNLPKGYEIKPSEDMSEADIVNAKGETVAHQNSDGTVSVKVKDQWVRQGPAGVREDDPPIQSKRDGRVIGHVGD